MKINKICLLLVSIVLSSCNSKYLIELDDEYYVTDVLLNSMFYYNSYNFAIYEHLDKFNKNDIYIADFEQITDKYYVAYIDKDYFNQSHKDYNETGIYNHKLILNRGKDNLFLNYKYDYYYLNFDSVKYKLDWYEYPTNKNIPNRLNNKLLLMIVKPFKINLTNLKTNAKSSSDFVVEQFEMYDNYESYIDKATIQYKKDLDSMIYSNDEFLFYSPFIWNYSFGNKYISSEYIFSLLRTKIKYFDNELYLYQKYYKDDSPTQHEKFKFNLLESLEYKEYFNDKTLEIEYYFKLDDLIEFSRQYHNK